MSISETLVVKDKGKAYFQELFERTVRGVLFVFSI